LKKVSAKFLTTSQRRNIKRQSYLNEVSQRNDSTFFATIGAFVLLPPLIILGIAILTGYVQLLPWVTIYLPILNRNICISLNYPHFTAKVCLLSFFVDKLLFAFSLINKWLNFSKEALSLLSPHNLLILLQNNIEEGFPKLKLLRQ